VRLACLVWLGVLVGVILIYTTGPSLALAPPRAVLYAIEAHQSSLARSGLSGCTCCLALHCTGVRWLLTRGRCGRVSIHHERTPCPSKRCTLVLMRCELASKRLPFLYVIGGHHASLFFFREYTSTTLARAETRDFTMVIRSHTVIRTATKVYMRYR
jgi:hypothetical protein